MVVCKLQVRVRVIFDDVDAGVRVDAPGVDLRKCEVEHAGSSGQAPQPPPLKQETGTQHQAVVMQACLDKWALAGGTYDRECRLR